MLTRDVVVEAVQAGVLNAHRKYEAWSGVDWIGDFGVEGFLVSEIASELHKAQRRDGGGTLCLELPFKTLKEWSGASKRGRTGRHWARQRRVDIALLNKEQSPIHAIEVKRQWLKSECRKDIEKLHSLVTRLSAKHQGTLKSGFLAVYYQGPRKPNKTLRKRMDDAKQYVRRLPTPGVNVRFHKELWPKRGFAERTLEGKTAEWEYGCHIIELSRKSSA